jgi:hypothetical protein
MPEYTVQVDESVAQSIRETAKLRKIPEDRCVGQILTSHSEEFRRFPDGILREGRQKVIALLSQIPCLSNFQSSGVDFRYWWVSFEVDIASPIAWRVIRKLGFLLNTQSTEMMLSTVFKPTPNEWPNEPMRWEIASTAPRLDPADVEIWLRDNLPQPMSQESAWTREE